MRSFFCCLTVLSFICCAVFWRNKRIIMEQQLKGMAYWKAPGPGRNTFWIKNLAGLHSWIAEQWQQYLDRGNVPDWMVSGKTKLATNDATKGAEVGNYIIYMSIAYLPTTFNVLTGIMTDSLYEHLDQKMEQIGCRRNRQCTKDQLPLTTW